MENRKKITVLLGTKRKMNTYRLLSQIEALLSPHNIELEIVELYRYEIKDCIGCEQCILKGKCVLTDDADALMQQLSTSDGIILASPVYLQQVSGRIKTFFDRTCCWYHRPVLAGKPILCVASTKGSGLKATLSYLDNIATQWGAIPAGSVGRSIFNQETPVNQKEISKFLHYLNHPEHFAPSFSQLMSFEVQKALSQHLNHLDTEYWQKMGWVSKPYFYPCRVNPVKSFITGSFGRYLQKKMASDVPYEDSQNPS